jgi:hypothetical protein
MENEKFVFINKDDLFLGTLTLGKAYESKSYLVTNYTDKPIIDSILIENDLGIYMMYPRKFFYTLSEMRQKKISKLI